MSSSPTRSERTRSRRLPNNRTPDHGEDFVPGSEGAPNLAPKTLDHFKRGHEERAMQRDRQVRSPHDDSRASMSIDDISGQERFSSSGNLEPREGDRSYHSVGRNSFQSNPRASIQSNGRTSIQSLGWNSFQSTGRASYQSAGRSSFQSTCRSSYQSAGRSSFQSRGSYRDSMASRSHRDSSFYDSRRSNNDGDRNGDRRHLVMGLDVQNLVDGLCRHNANVFALLDETRQENLSVFSSGKAVTAIISNLARRRNVRLAMLVWDWVDSVGIEKNTFHYNTMISVCEKVRDYRKALSLLEEMTQKRVPKNEITFSSAISACEKCSQWRTALDLLERMKNEGVGLTVIAYNAAISACEKGLVPNKALEVFEQMKRDRVTPTVVTYSALISAAEKGQQWKLALEVLEEMKTAGFGANVIAYSAAISALSKGQQWHKALELFREIEASGGKPSIVTYNATMTALEKGLQWEQALDLFDEMKTKNMPITVVSYGSAISACEKGLQYRQCLEFLDEMTGLRIKKNVIIFGAAMSCMDKSCRADIAFQLMERMKIEQINPNVHIYNSAISACARCNLWEKGYELFLEMEKVGVARDVVTYNAVLDAVCSQHELGRKLFKEGVEMGFYSKISRLGTQWLELDLHFLSLGGGEVALGWWFDECLAPYLTTTSKLEALQNISIVTGYGKTRSRGARVNDDGMRLRVRAMLDHMGIKETPQANKGRIHIAKEEFVKFVEANGGNVVFDQNGYSLFKQEQTTANKFPDVPQKVRARFRLASADEGSPGTLIREGSDEIDPGYEANTSVSEPPPSSVDDRRLLSMHDRRPSPPRDSCPDQRRDCRVSSRDRNDSEPHQDYRRASSERGSGYSDDRRPRYTLDRRAATRNDVDRRSSDRSQDCHRSSASSDYDSRYHNREEGRRERDPGDERWRSSYRESWKNRGDHDSRSSIGNSVASSHRYDHDKMSDSIRIDEARPFDDQDRNFSRHSSRNSYHDHDRYNNQETASFRSSDRDRSCDRRPQNRRDKGYYPNPRDDRGGSFDYLTGASHERARDRNNAPISSFHDAGIGDQSGYHSRKRVSDSVLYSESDRTRMNMMKAASALDERELAEFEIDDHHDRKRPRTGPSRRQSNSRGYDIEPTYAKRKSL